MDEIRKHGAAQGLMVVQTRAGERRIWEYKNTLRTDGVAEPIVRGMARDITERKHAENALRESERRYSDMLSKIKLISMTLDRDARVTFCNDYLLQADGLATRGGPRFGLVRALHSSGKRGIERHLRGAAR